MSRGSIFQCPLPAHWRQPSARPFWCLPGPPHRCHPKTSAGLHSSMSPLGQRLPEVSVSSSPGVPSPLNWGGGPDFRTPTAPPHPRHPDSAVRLREAGCGPPSSQRTECMRPSDPAQARFKPSKHLLDLVTGSHSYDPISSGKPQSRLLTCLKALET